MTDKSHRWWRGALVAVYSVVAALILLEVALRVVDPIGIRYYFEARRYFDTFTVDDSVFAYIHKTGFEGTLQGARVSINSEGLRSPEFSVQKPEGEKRLLILGDSVVFGWGAPQDSIFSAVVRARLANVAPAWSVISAGVGSWNTRTEYEWLRERGLRYAPDALVLLAVPNDVEPKVAGRTQVDKATLQAVLDQGRGTGAFSRLKLKAQRAGRRFSYVFATMSHIQRLRAQASPLAAMLEPDSPAWRDAADALDGIVTLCREHDIDLVVYLWGDGSTDLSKRFMDAYGNYLDSRGVPHVQFPSRLFQRDYQNSLVDRHPNAAGHAVMADALYRTLQPIVSVH